MITTEYIILVDSLNFVELMKSKLVDASVRFHFKLASIRHYDMSVSHLPDETPIYFMQIIYQYMQKEAVAAKDYEDRSHSYLSVEMN